MSSPLRRSPRKKGDDLGSPSSRTRSSLDVRLSPSKYLQTSVQLANVTGFATFPSSPWEQPSTPDWYQLMVELPEEEDEEYHPEDEEEDEDEEPVEDWEFDLQELLKDAQQEIVLPKPLNEMMEDDDDTEYEPDDDEDDDEEEIVYDPSEFDLEELLRDAQQEVPILPKPLTELMEDLESDDEDYNPIEEDDEEEEEEDIDTVMDFDIEQLLRDAQQDLMNPYTPQAQERMEQETRHVQDLEQKLSVKDLLSLRRDQMKLQKEQRQQSQPIWTHHPVYQSTTTTDYKTTAKNITAPHNAGTTTKDIGIHQECEHCDRVFRGPKASTHKQQHIKRIHPERYVRKKGGKRVSNTIRFVT